MSAITNWGPSTWNFFHTLAENVKEDHEDVLIPKLFFYIKSICLYLPCPECTEHATAFMSKITPNKISNKHDFKGMLYVFHNLVNSRKKYKCFKYDELDKYKNRQVFAAFQAFSHFFNTKGNMKVYADTVQRIKLIAGFRSFLQKNKALFIKF
jgi:hypothetical protein